jgi:hypothetical protein
LSKRINWKAIAEEVVELLKTTPGHRLNEKYREELRKLLAKLKITFEEGGNHEV